MDVKPGSGRVGALDYERATKGVSSGSNPRMVRPSISDFICDVELKLRKALPIRSEYKFIEEHYLNCQDDAPRGTVNDSVTEKAGRMFVAVGIYPVHDYFNSRDCR
jgi:hypothetical protein